MRYRIKNANVFQENHENQKTEKMIYITEFGADSDHNFPRNGESVLMVGLNRVLFFK